MIKASEIFTVGKILKSFGISGEMLFVFYNDVFDRTESPYWVFDMDGIYVPFFIEYYEIRTDETAIVKIEGIENDKDVRKFIDKEIYYPKKFDDGKIPESELSYNSFMGFTVYDEKSVEIGKIVNVDFSTVNILFEIAGRVKSFLIPVADDYIENIDIENKKIYMRLPDGILDI